MQDVDFFQLDDMRQFLQPFYVFQWKLNDLIQGNNELICDNIVFNFSPGGFDVPNPGVPKNWKYSRIEKFLETQPDKMKNAWFFILKILTYGQQ